MRRRSYSILPATTRSQPLCGRSVVSN